MLQQWLLERRDAEQVRRRLEVKVAEWVRLGRGRGGLLDDLELLEARQWLAGPDALDLGVDPDLPALISLSAQAGDARKEALAYRGVAHSMSAMDDHQQVIEAIVREGRNLVDFALGLVLLASQEPGELYVAASHPAEHARGDARIPAAGRLDAVLRGSGAQIIDDLSQDDGIPELVTFAGYRSACLIPLRAQQRTYGVLAIASEAPAAFTSPQVDRLTALANYAIIALHNAQLMFDLKEERGRLLAKEEEIRHQLARDLHDGPAQALAAIMMNIEYIKRLLGDHSKRGRA